MAALATAIMEIFIPEKRVKGYKVLIVHRFDIGIKGAFHYLARLSCKIRYMSFSVTVLQNKIYVISHDCPTK